MRKNKVSLLISHTVLLLLIIAMIFIPNQRETTRAWYSMAAGLSVIEGIFLFAAKRKGRAGKGGCYDIILLVWSLLLVWELCTSVLNVAHPVLIPCPENVFDTFRERWWQLLLNVLYSMELLAFGFFPGLLAAVGLGLIAGWFPRIRNFAAPIANVMAPIPAIVFSPYLVALMPSFRSASMVVIFLGVFWPNFLTTVNRVNSIEPQIMDSARMMHLSNRHMIRYVLLPYIIPGVISGLKVSLTTSLLMLNFAELMGATHGMGYFIQNSITYANYTHAVAGIIVIGIVVTGLNRITGIIQAKAIKWH